VAQAPLPPATARPASTFGGQARPGYRPRRRFRPFKLLLSLALLGLSAGVGKVWLEYREDEADKPLAPLVGDGFSVSMPGKPKQSTRTTFTQVGSIEIIVYLSDGRHKAYALAYNTIPLGGELDVATAIAGAAKGVKGVAQDEVDTTHQGFPARDARITHATDDKSGIKGTIFLRMIVAKGRVYQLLHIAEGPDVKVPHPTYAEFLASFKIE
jgi:hypothetical protein